MEEAINKVGKQVKLPRGYHINWEGEYESEKRAAARLSIIVPLTILMIFIILYTMFKSFKWASADPRERHDGAAGRHAGVACSPTRTSASLRASDFWRCSASRCRPA